MTEKNGLLNHCDELINIAQSPKNVKMLKILFNPSSGDIISKVLNRPSINNVVEKIENRSFKYKLVRTPVIKKNKDLNKRIYPTFGTVSTL